MIKFTGNLRLDFEKATAEITKLKDRILGYQEQIASLQASARNLRRSKECDKKQYAESLVGAANPFCGIVNSIAMHRVADDFAPYFVSAK